MQEIEKFLQESGVTGEMESMMTQTQTAQTTEQVAIETTQQTTQETQAVETQTTTVETGQTAETTTTEEKPWYETVGTQTVQTTESAAEDFKAKYEEVYGKLSKYEGNKLLKQLADVIEAPGFDEKKFFDAIVPKTIDYTQIPLENLYKNSLAQDDIAGYTDAEIEEKWQEEKTKLEGNSAAQKALKSELVRQLRSTEQTASIDEPEIFKEWKEQRIQAENNHRKNAADMEDLTKGISSSLASFVGKDIGGFKVTDEHIKSANERMNLEYYKLADGKWNKEAIAFDRLAGAIIKDMVKHFGSDAIIEARKQITRPNNTVGAVANVGQSAISEEDRIIMEGMKANGFSTEFMTTITKQ